MNLTETFTKTRKCTSNLLLESCYWIPIFKEAAALNSRNSNYQFWKQDTEPKIIYTPEFARQKLEYIHNNPVDAGIAQKAEEYIYSSARDYYHGKQCGLLKVEFLL